VIRHLIQYKTLKIISVILTLFVITFSSELTTLKFGVTPANAQVSGSVPGNWSGSVSDSEIWRAVRKGISGTVTIPDKKAAQLVQADGDNWRAIKNGPLSRYGGFLLLAVFMLLGLFYVGRGKIMIDGGPCGETIQRFNGIERFAHWLTAFSFVILSLTGLNILYGRYLLKPILGPELFSLMTEFVKISHNYIAFAFIIGIILMLFCGSRIISRTSMILNGWQWVEGCFQKEFILPLDDLMLVKN
jgi:formate dehydrogenase subunit gamma